MSNDFIYPDLPTHERLEQLKNICVAKQTMTYQRTLSDQEIDAEKDRFCQDSIERDKKKDEAKMVASTFKSQIESMEKLMNERLERIKTGQTELVGDLYLVPDHAKGRMNFYDKYGERVNSRELTPDERQGRLFIGDGTNNDKVEDLEHEDIAEAETHLEFVDDDGNPLLDDDGNPINEEPEDMPI